jgi:DNA-binding NtrC family response regulator
MPAARPKVLVVERESPATTALIAFLRGYGLATSWAGDGEAADRALAGTRVDALVAPLRSPRIDGMALCRRARERHAEVCVVLSADAARAPAIVAALAAGALDVLPRPLDHERLLAVLERGFAQQRMAARLVEMEARLDERFGVAPFTGRSRAIARVMEQVRHLASTHTAVLIEGEDGTGKRLAARAIHQNSPRRHAPFVEIDCGALAEPLLERELFGREEGAGADGDGAPRGRLDSADGGTLLLSEVDDLPPGVQVRLLRVLQDRAFERVGGQATVKVDVRLIAATRHDLEARVREGRFREDLFHRLGVVRIVMPPLRDRLEDLPLLVVQLLLEAGRGRPRGAGGITRGVLDRLLAHPWPGNVRELRDTIESMVMVAGRGRALGLADLPQALRPAADEAGRLAISAGMTVEESERQLITATLAQARNDKPRAAALLGIGLRTLYRKLEEYGIR